MKRIKVMGLTLIAVLAASAMTTATAASANPLFLSCAKVVSGLLFEDSHCTKEKAGGGWSKVTVSSGTFTGTSGVGALTSTGITIKCTSDLSSGEITGANTVGKVVVTFHGCKGEEATKTCTIKSTNTSSVGLIVTVTLKGTLGLVAAAEATSGVGLLLEPETGKVFTVIGAGGCALSGNIEGSVAGEATPVNSLISTTGKLIFTKSGTGEKIKKITVKGLAKSPELLAFGNKAGEETTEEVTYGEEIEVC